MSRTKYEWPVVVGRLGASQAVKLVTLWAPVNASRSTLNELAVKRARELGHATAEPLKRR